MQLPYCQNARCSCIKHGMKCSVACGHWALSRISLLKCRQFHCGWRWGWRWTMKLVDEEQWMWRWKKIHGQPLIYEQKLLFYHAFLSCFCVYQIRLQLLTSKVDMKVKYEFEIFNWSYNCKWLVLIINESEIFFIKSLLLKPSILQLNPAWAHPL